MNAIISLRSASHSTENVEDWDGFRTDRNYLAVPVDSVADEARRSKKSGRLPRSVAVTQRERSDESFRVRMQAARLSLAQEFESVQPRTIADLRLAAGFSQRQLAEKMNTSQSHIAKIEGGSVQLYWVTATRLADALDISLDGLRQLIPMRDGVPTLKGTTR